MVIAINAAPYGLVVSGAACSPSSSSTLRLALPRSAHDDDDDESTKPHVAGKIAVAVTIVGIAFFILGLWLFCRAQDRKLRRIRAQYAPVWPVTPRSTAVSASPSGPLSLPSPSRSRSGPWRPRRAEGERTDSTWRIDWPFAPSSSSPDSLPTATTTTAHTARRDIEEGDGLPRYEDRRADVLLHPVAAPPQYSTAPSLPPPAFQPTT